MYLGYVIMLGNALSKSHQFPDGLGHSWHNSSTDFVMAVVLYPWMVPTCESIHGYTDTDLGQLLGTHGFTHAEPYGYISQVTEL